MKNRKWIALTALILVLAILVTVGCKNAKKRADTSGFTLSADELNAAYSAYAGYVDLDTADLDTAWNTGTITEITLNGDSVAVQGNGAFAKGSTVTINSPGTYHVTGTLADGQLLVNSSAHGRVWLVFDGVSITCATSAPVFIRNSDSTILTLADGSDNTLTDAASYTFADGEDEPKAALFSKDDLTINGTGALTVNGNYDNGIQSKDALRIAGGTITVTAVNDGIKGKDMLGIYGGTLTVTSGGDGLCSDNEDEAAMGRVYIAAGTCKVVSSGDAIEGKHYLLITGGDFELTSGGGSANAAAKTPQDANGMPGNFAGFSGGGTAPGAASSGTSGDASADAAAGTADGSSQAAASQPAPPNGTDGSAAYPGTSGGTSPDASAGTADGSSQATASLPTPPNGTDGSAGTAADPSASGAAAGDTGTAAADGTKTGTSGKSLKGGTDVTLLGGVFAIDGADDAVHSNGNVTIGGTADLTISTGDDAVHADGTTSVTGGSIDVLQCYEGLEGTVVSVSGGEIKITASDDGINAAGDAGDIRLEISGGNIYVNAAGDGLDANGAITQTGGTVYVDGPTDSGNGALDYDSGYTMTGGTLVAAGSAGMSLAISESGSTVNCAYVGFTSAQAAGTVVSVADASGREILSYTPAKVFQTIVIASPDIQTGETYTVLCGGASVGTFTAGSVVSTIGTITSMGGGGMGGGMGGQGAMPSGGGQTQPGARPGRQDGTSAATANAAS